MDEAGQRGFASGHGFGLLAQGAPRSDRQLETFSRGIAMACILVGGLLPQKFVAISKRPQTGLFSSLSR